MWYRWDCGGIGKKSIFGEKGKSQEKTDFSVIPGFLYADLWVIWFYAGVPAFPVLLLPFRLLLIGVILRFKGVFWFRWGNGHFSLFVRFCGFSASAVGVSVSGFHFIHLPGCVLVILQIASSAAG